MAGVYGMLAKLISPQSLFSLGRRVFSSYYSVGKVQIVESRRGYSQATAHGSRRFRVTSGSSPSGHKKVG